MVNLRKKLTEFCVLIAVVLLITCIVVSVGAIIKERVVSIRNQINLQYEYIDFTEGIPLGGD